MGTNRIVVAGFVTLLVAAASAVANQEGPAGEKRAEPRAQAQEGKPTQEPTDQPADKPVDKPTDKPAGEEKGKPAADSGKGDASPVQIEKKDGASDSGNRDGDIKLKGVKRFTIQGGSMPEIIEVPPIEVPEDTEQAREQAASILDKYVDGAGGKDAFAAVRNRRMTGVYEIPARNMVYNMTVVEARPSKRYTRFSGEEPLQPLESGTDGVIAWTRVGSQEPAIKEGKDLALAVAAAAFHPYADWREHFTKVLAAGADVIDGRPCQKVVLIPKVGFPICLWFDDETGLVTRRQESFEEDGPSMLTTYSDYRKVDGLMLPHLEEIVYHTMNRIKTYHLIEQNVADLSVTRFDPPSNEPPMPEGTPGD